MQPYAGWVPGTLLGPEGGKAERELSSWGHDLHLRDLGHMPSLSCPL